jgi:phage tail-like protein
MLDVQTFLPPIPRPPHDPTWWLLNSRTGWHAAEVVNVEVSPARQSLALAPAPNSLPSPTGSDGTFGGVNKPANVAVGPDGRIFLLDLKTAELKLFDPCCCRFVVVPCFGSSGARQLQNAHSIAICDGKLFVCDTGNHRVIIFSLHGFVMRGVLRPPPGVFTKDWEPYSIAFDGLGRAFVSDGANGIHRFAPDGRWERCLSGFGSVKDIAVDCHDEIYVVVEGEPSVRVVNGDGMQLREEKRSDAFVSNFPCLPFAIDGKGRLDLFCQCKGSATGDDCGSKSTKLSCLFDLSGNLIAESPQSIVPQFPKTGSYLSEQLDSNLYRCTWHRVVLYGRIPAGTSIRVLTYTAETLQPKDYVQSLPEDQWETIQTAHKLEDGVWDCLITSGGGRFLCLRLEFKGNGANTPEIDRLRIEFPRISLRRYLPAVFAEDAGGANFTDRFLSIFDTTLRSIEKKVDEQARFFDPLSTPAETKSRTGADFLSFLASWIGVTIDRYLAPEKRREALKRAASLYAIRGTREGLKRQLLFFLGLEPEKVCCAGDQPVKRCVPAAANCVTVEHPACAWQAPPLILEHYQLRRWLFLGTGRLGDQAVLWGKRVVNRSQLDEGAQVGQTQLRTTQDPLRDPFYVYAHKFSVFVPVCYSQSDTLRKGLENLLNSEKPAHAQFQLVFVEPRFRIGFQSMIGLDSVVGRYPTAGVTLNESLLGADSILTKPPERQGAPSFEVGNQSRVGTTTKLE